MTDSDPGRWPTYDDSDRGRTKGDHDIHYKEIRLEKRFIFDARGGVSQSAGRSCKSRKSSSLNSVAKVEVLALAELSNVEYLP